MRKILYFIYLLFSCYVIADSQTCNNADQFPMDIFFGFSTADKTDENRNNALNALGSIEGWLSNPNAESFLATSGNVAAYAWVGSMVQNEGFRNNIFPIMKDEVYNNGMPRTIYIEYANGDPLKGFGVIVNSENNPDIVKNVAKLWSSGKNYNNHDGTKTYNSYTVCYLAYGSRKPVNNDEGIGQCDYIKVESGMVVSDATGVNGESLQGYNPNVDFSKLVVGQPICYSIGSSPKWEKPQECENSDPVVQNIFFGFKWRDNDRSDQKTNDAITTLDIMSGWALDYSKNSFYHQENDVTGYMWIGSMVQNSGFVKNIIPVLKDELKNYGITTLIYIEYMPGDPMKSFGVMLNTANDPDSVKKAGRLWSSGKKFDDFNGSKDYNDKTICYLSYDNRKSGTTDDILGQCDYITMKQGMDLEAETGVNGETLQEYNPSLDFSSLQEGMPICYSLGTKPDLRPKKNDDGSCFEYQVQDGDSCSSIQSSYYPLSNDDLNDFNKNTYGWYGCKKLMKDQKICLSEGEPPRPEPNPLAECGPLAPGDLYNSECPLFACCSEFGFCGLTSEFCETKDSDTNAPGTNGCFSNCGYGSLHTDRKDDFKRIAYWMDSEGDLSTDPTEFEDDYDTFHYAFVNINSDFSIDTSKIENSQFLDININKVASFGGWDFSTSQNTYNIFREGTNENNRENLANNMVNFLNEYQLDGLDIDWEYPGAPDIPDIPADSKDSPKNYLEFLKLLRSKMPSDKTLSIAIPSSYWYLKLFPITDIQQYVDYMVFMSYDIYGTWDLQKDNSVKCHANKTDIINSLKLLDKAHVELSKILGGVTNYGRSYKYSDDNCKTINCPFSEGGNSRSITNTKGVLADSEISQIDTDGSKNSRWTDDESQCIFMNYDDNCVVSWTEDRNDLIDFFHGSGLRGTSLWAINYFDHDPSDSDDNDEDDDDDEEQVGDADDSYVDIYDCKNKATLDFTNPEYGCKYETAIKFVIDNGTKAIDVIDNILDDYKNYLTYYDKVTKANFDEIMTPYAQWAHVNLKSYFVQPTKVKRDTPLYTTNDMNVDYNKTTIDIIMEHLNVTQVVLVQPDAEVLITKSNLTKRSSFPMTYVISGMIIPDEKKDDAAKAFSEYSNYTITKDAFYTQTKKDPVKYITIPGGDTITFDTSSILDQHVIFPNIMNGITKDNITSIQSLIDYANDNLGNENPFYIYEVIESVLIFSEIADTAQFIYTEGKKIKDEQNKMKIILILSIVFGIIGGLSLFMGPIGVGVSILSDLIIFTSNVGINGTVDAETLALSLVGMFLPIFAEVSISSRFAKIFELIRLNKLKNYDTLSNFKYIKETREFLGRAKSCKN